MSYDIFLNLEVAGGQESNGPLFPIHHGRARQNNNVWTGLFVQLSRRFS